MLPLAHAVDIHKLNAPFVNIDILHNVILYADLSTILQLSKTCHEFNAECAPSLLKRRVRLDREHSVESFVAFLTASGRRSYSHRRLAFFTNVELDLGPSPSQSIRFLLAQAFAYVRTLGSRFTHLVLHHSNALLAPDSPLSKSVGALTTLRHLALLECGRHCDETLFALQYQLVSVKFQAVDRRTMCPAKEPRQYFIEDPLHVLHGLPTLHGASTDLPMTLRQAFYSPNVTELAIKCANYLPITGTYVRWFPNLQRLAVDFNRRMLSPARSRLARPFRQQNAAEQHCSRSWRSLRRVEGSLQDVCLLGVTCAIPELSLVLTERAVMDDGSNAREADAWREVLASARPAHLALRVLDSGWIVNQHGFDLLCHTPQLVALPSLAIHAYAMYPMGLRPEVGYMEVLDCLQAILLEIRPAHVSITLDWTRWFSEDDGDDDDDDDDEEDEGEGEEINEEAETNLLRGVLESEAADIEQHTCMFVHEGSRAVRLSLVGPDGGWRRDMTWRRSHVPPASGPGSVAVAGLPQCESMVY